MSYLTLPDERKRDFAVELLRNPKNAYMAAYKVFNDVGQASYAAHYWVNDPDVLAFKRELANGGDSSEYLPTKDDVSLIAYEMANDGDLEARDRLAALQLYAKLRGYIERPPQAVINNANVQQNTVNKVMIVPAHMDDTEWEVALKQQQSRLSQDTQNASDKFDLAE